MLVRKNFFVFMAPAGEDSTAGDRGDSWAPTEADLKAAQALRADPLPGTDADEAAKKLEAEAEAAAAATAQETAQAGKDPAGKNKDSRIPLARHKEILERERASREALEAELAKYRQGAQVAATNVKIDAAEANVVKMEAEYTKLLLDGQPEKAAELRTKIRQTERQINEQAASVREAAAEARAVERVRYDVTVERLEAEYPELNVDDAAFDKSKVAEVMELKDAYQGRGYTPSAALQKAVKLLMPPKTRAQERVTEVEARVSAADVAAARKAEAASKTAEAVGRTPPSTTKVGADSDKLGGGGPITGKDVMKMDQAAFAKLNEETLARLRGDTL